ncbi:MAG: hypothetical protein H6970_08060 [Gammaproteobacteria bacterium]|nr:hypothetical protein [Gammaproteobacteria bacterium]MCP5458016.1 hypothetical protein [Gammaproteobacteria bacterium]
MTIELPGVPVLTQLSKPVLAKIEWDELHKTLTITEPLSSEDVQQIKSAVIGTEAASAIKQAAVASRTTAVEFFKTPAELGIPFKVPQLALWKQGELFLFDDTDLLEYPWDLALYDAHPNHDELARLDSVGRIASTGELDIDGVLAVAFVG